MESPVDWSELVNDIVKGRKPKSNEEFFKESCSAIVDKGKDLSKIAPEIVDEYSDHSMLKLIAISYWVGIFAPIAHRRLKDQWNYIVAYIDTMAGSGVTLSSRGGDSFCGSFPCALNAAASHQCPFDIATGVEIDEKKAMALKARVDSLGFPTKTRIIDRDIELVAAEIADRMRKRTISYVVIDPQAFHGVAWRSLSPLLALKGDALVTWFEAEAWRMKEAAITKKSHASSKGDEDRLTELLGDERWKSFSSPAQLTEMFIDRVKTECKKSAAVSLRIERSPQNYYMMILFTGDFPNAEKLAKEWKTNLERRIQSVQGKPLETILDVHAKRATTLNGWINGAIPE